MKWTNLLALLNQAHLNDLFYFKGIMSTIDTCITGFKNVKMIETDIKYLPLRFSAITLEITQGLETQGFRFILDNDAEEIVEISLVWEW